MSTTRPGPRDALVAGLVVALVVLDLFVQLDTPRIDALTVTTGVLAGLSLVLRRQRPLAVLGIVWCCGVVPTLVEGVDPSFYASYVPFLVAGYTQVTHARSRRESLWMPAASAAIYLAFLARTPDFREPGQVIFNLVSLALVYGAGRGARVLRDRADLEASRSALLLREHDVAAREAVVAERERIARELHDVIAHEVSVMVIHAAAAQRLVPDQSPDVGEALAQIQQSGRAAIEELHLLLGMLRGDEADRAPQPGLAALPDLVAEVCRSGVDTTLERTGDLRTLGGALDVSAYRLVQEALTNVLKHASGSRAAVWLDYRADGLVISVVDDGATAASSTPTPEIPSGGHGLVGMRERVRLFGGALEVGARTGGGWSVRATLPMFDESA